MRSRKFFLFIVLLFFIFFLSSCEQGMSPFAVISIEKIGETEEGYIYEITFVDNNSYELIVPFGIDGTHGETPYIGSNGNWWIGNNDLGVKVTGEKGAPGTDGKDGIDGVNGKDGKDGIDGIDGKTPYIGSNGNWWIGNTDLGYKVEGQDGIDGIDGTDGKTPYIGSNGNWWIGDTDLGYKAEGQDGIDGIDGTDGETPYIGSNGNWWIGNTDLGYKVEGQDGIDGVNGSNGIDGQTPYIGTNGNWWIGEIDTGSYAGYNPDKIFETGTFEFARNSDGNSYYLAKYTGYDRIVNIPAVFNGYPVTAIGLESFINNEIIEKIIISNAIIKIEKKAFYNMKNLETVIFEEESQLTIIEESAFQNSSNLSNIYLPNGLEIIGENAFKNTGLIDLVVPNTVELIGKGAFYNISSLETITFSNDANVTIEKEAFAYAINLTSLKLPDSLTIINDSVFLKSESLSYVTLPENLEKVKKSAFESSGLVSITIPKTVTEIDEKAFFDLINLESLNFNNESQLTKIGKQAFKNASNIKNLIIPKSVVYIETEAFMNMSELETLVFETDSDLTIIGPYAFYGMQNLNELNIPNKVEVISDFAFGNSRTYGFHNYNITSIIVPNTVVEIGEGAFQAIYGLEYISVPFVGGSRKVGTSLGSEFTSPYLFGYIFGSDNYDSYTRKDVNKVYQGQDSNYHTGMNAGPRYRKYYIPDTLMTIVITDAVNGVSNNAFFGLDDRNITY